MSRRLLPTLACMAALLIGGASATRAAEPVKIRIAWIVPVSNIAPILFAKSGLTKHLGKSYIIEPVKYQGTPPMITGLSVDELDVSLLGFSSLHLAIQNAGLDSLRIFADEIQDGAEGYATNEYLVRNDSDIKNVSDLKGKVIATNVIGSGVDIAFRAQMKQAGLVDKKDYTVVETPFGAMKAMLSEKKVDMISAVLPFSQDPQLRSVARTLFTQRDAMGLSELGIWVAKKEFLDRNKAAVIDFLEDAIVAVRWYMDPKNHDEAVQIASKFAKIPPAAFDSWLFTKKDYYRDPNLMPNVKALQANLDLQLSLGVLKTKLDVSKYTDTSLLEQALKRLP